MAERNVDTSVILIGNPGTGKSTLLNSLLEHYDPEKQFERFESGVSIGTGLTTTTKRVKVHDKIFVDTPGLSDIETRKEAAKQIYSALKTAGLCQIIFVVTLESGRIRADDCTTIKLVLNASPDITKYGIICNKVSASVMQQIRKNHDILKQFILEIQHFDDDISSEMPFAYPLVLERIAELDDEQDVHVSIPQLTYFRETVLPTVKIEEQNVQEIKESMFDSVKEKMQMEMEVMRDDNERKARKYEELKSRIQMEEEKQMIDFDELLKKLLEIVFPIVKTINDLTSPNSKLP